MVAEIYNGGKDPVILAEGCVAEIEGYGHIGSVQGGFNLTKDIGPEARLKIISRYRSKGENPQMLILPSGVVVKAVE